MISESDVRGLRYALSQFQRRWIDISRADVRVMHGVLHVRGNLRIVPGAPFKNLEAEVEHVVKCIRGRPEIREVVLDVSYS